MIMLGVCFGMLVVMICGFGVVEFCEVGLLIMEVLDGLKVVNSEDGIVVVEVVVKVKVEVLIVWFLIYGG